jgi:DNA-binding NtrC family response regulator
LASLSEILNCDSLVKAILSRQGEKDNAPQAIGAGAYDFLPKPADLDVLQLLLKRAFCNHSKMPKPLGAADVQGNVFSRFSL